MAEVEDWKDLNLDLFNKCREQLKVDEFVYSDERFDSYKLMSALDVNSPRIDPHLLAKGIFSYSDIVSKGITLPNENISFDEIRGILGKLFDLQVSLFDGFNVYQTVLISVYANKFFEIKNELLKYCIYCFQKCWSSVEEYANNIFPGSNAYWTVCDHFDNNIPEDIPEKQEIIDFLQNFEKQNPETKDICQLSLFELELADYIKYFPTKEQPVLPEGDSMVQLSSEIGIYPSIHYRKLPYHSPPTKIVIYNHEQAITKTNEFLKIAKELQTFPKLTTFIDIITNVFEWGYSHKDAISFARVLLAGFITQGKEQTYYHETKQIDFLKHELANYRVPDPLFKLNEFPSYANLAFKFMDSIIHILVAPLAYAHAALSKYLMASWGEIERAFLSLETVVAPSWHYPATGIKETDQILKTSTMIWFSPISVKLVEFYITLGFATETYGKDDHANAALILENAYRTYTFVSDRKLIFNSIMAAADKKRKTQKKKHITLKPSEYSVKQGFPPDYYVNKAKREYFSGCFHLSRWLYKKGIIPHHTGIFYDASNTYWDRAMNPNRMFSIEVLPKEDFASEFNYENVPEEEIAKQAKQKFDYAKSILMHAIQTEGKSDLITNMMKTIITTYCVFNIKPGETVNISYNTPGEICYSIKK